MLPSTSRLVILPLFCAPLLAMLLATIAMQLLVHDVSSIKSLTYGSLVGRLSSCDGRVVKALDSKSNGIFPRRFESCSQRIETFSVQCYKTYSIQCRNAVESLVPGAVS